MEALNAVARPMAVLFNTSVAQNPFYVAGMGLDRPWQNMARMVITFVAVSAYLLVAAILAWLNHAPSRRASLMGPVLPLGLAVVPLFASGWGTFALGLPLFCLSGLLAMAGWVRARATTHEAAVAAAPILMLAACGLVLLFKVGLNPRLGHYGFYLAMPASVVFIVTVCWLIPALLRPWSPPRGRSNVPADRHWRDCGRGAAVPDGVAAVVSGEDYARRNRV